MSHPEFLSWLDFYELHPFDDLHRFYRPAALVATALGGGAIEDRLDWLEPPAAVASGQLSDADMNTLKAFGIKPPGRN